MSLVIKWLICVPLKMPGCLSPVVKLPGLGRWMHLNWPVLRGLIRILQKISAAGKLVMPAFCDSHTHLVYAGSRELEYMDKIRGLSYEEIARRGGGILNSAALLQATPEEELYEQSLARIREIMQLGTGAVEIKSGYGLSTEAELKMLRVIRTAAGDDTHRY